jgi:tRNA A37 methylthiotransferase MiaB
LDDENVVTIEEEIQPKLKAGARMIVCGCMPAISRSLLLRYHSGPTFTPRSQEKIEELLGGVVSFADVPLPTFEGEPSRQFDPAAKAFKNFETNVCRIRIAEGCLGNCSYCGIRMATGRLQSTPIDRIVDQFRAGLQAGYFKFCLDAEDTAAYGQDIGTNIAALVRSLLEIPDDFMLGLYDLNPRWTEKYYTELWPLFLDQRIKELVFPFQSGSPRILRLMNRLYDVKEFEQRIVALRASRPDLIFGTSVIAGFPTEQPEDLQQTLHLLNLFDWSHVHIYSDRDGTASSKLDGKISKHVKALRALQAKLLIDGENFEGFYEPEPGGYRWARRKAFYDLAVPGHNGTDQLALTLRPVIGYAGGQRITVRAQHIDPQAETDDTTEAVLLGEHWIVDQPSDRDLDFNFPLPALRQGTILRVMLETDKWTIPAKSGGTDGRELGLYVKQIRLASSHA